VLIKRLTFDNIGQTLLPQAKKWQGLKRLAFQQDSSHIYTDTANELTQKIPDVSLSRDCEFRNLENEGILSF
jgi:hypothetical protein